MPEGPHRQLDRVGIDMRVLSVSKKFMRINATPANVRSIPITVGFPPYQQRCPAIGTDPKMGIDEFSLWLNVFP